MPAPFTTSPDFDGLMDALPTGWEKLAHDMKAIGTRETAVIKDPRVLMRALMLNAGCDLPLRQTAAILAEANIVDTNHVTIHRRVMRAGPLVQELVAQMGKARTEQIEERWGGYTPILLDGSVVVTPKFNEWDGRLHAAMRLHDQCILQAHISTTKDGESLKRFSFEPGHLAVADRGFSNPVGIQSVVAQGADVLVRVNRGSLPLFDEAAELIDLHAWVGELGDSGRTHARRVFTQGPSARIDGRLIAKRLPKDKRAEARKRARAEFGDNPVALDLSEWMLLFTTTAKLRLSDAQSIELYRLRWQVELLFKRMKSLSNLGGLPNYRPDSVLTWLGIKVLMYMCAERFAQPTTSPTSPASRGFSPLRSSPSTTPHRARSDDTGTAAMEADLHLVAAPHFCGVAHVLARSRQASALDRG